MKYEDHQDTKTKIKFVKIIQLYLKSLFSLIKTLINLLCNYIFEINQ